MKTIAIEEHFKIPAIIEANSGGAQEKAFKLCVLPSRSAASSSIKVPPTRSLGEAVGAAMRGRTDHAHETLLAALL
jgi:hypothetical protein